MLYLDTRVVVWLYAKDEARQEHDLLVSPVVILELEYLHETKRITEHGATIVEDLTRRIGLRAAQASLDGGIQERHANAAWA